MISSSNELDGRSAAAPSTEGEYPRRWAVLAVLAAVGFMAQLDLFIVNLAIPAIGTSFPDAGLGGLSWVLSAYAIVFGALLVPAGRYADRFGRRGFLLAGVALFTAASVLCAVAPTLPLLVAGRVIQAVGAAAIMPTSLALLYPAFPARLHSTAVGIWAGAAAVAATAGPAVGGLLVAVDWRWVFLVNVPIGVAVLVAGARLLPAPAIVNPARPPQPSSVLALLVAVSALVWATTELAERGVGPLVVVLFGLAAIGVAATIASTLRHAHPLVDRALFSAPGFGRAAVALVAFFVAFAAWLLIGVLFLQNAWGYTAFQAGVALAPGPLAAALTALASGRIVASVGARVPAMVGPLLVAAAGLYWLLCTPPTPDYVGGFLIGQILGGVGSGLTQAPLFAAAGSLPPHHATTGSAFLTMCRQLGSALGVALLVAVCAVPPSVGLGSVSLETFHHGWALVVVAALLATLVQLRVPARRTH